MLDDLEVTGDAPAPRVRVLVVDDDMLVCQVLRDYLATAPEMDVVASLSTGEDAVAFVRSGEPVDVVLMDVRLPGMSGIEAAAITHAVMPGARVIMLTSYANPDFIGAALRAGAVGYLLKNTRAAQLVAAVRAVRQGLPVLSPEVLPSLGRRAGVPAVGAPALGDREAAVLRHLCRGMSNAEIAHEIYLSESSVKAYVHTLMVKLHVDSRLKLVVRAQELGLAGGSAADQ